ncbi:hypothetical protein CY0110_18762 [Crocosphaera chwakensis CCY0110]|uniref:Uncharacterized protein n=1 Tax=Crocosphaera chwakensis CCY0110 TaxID=391612 RepID=A3IJ84_9CHRO|nr:hypothetical protein CY0110_18762 [Crocosphaera chwakensis CCY0110]
MFTKLNDTFDPVSLRLIISVTRSMRSTSYH